MRAVLTRVNSASVAVEGRITGQIGRGFLILLGIGPGDTEADCDKLCKKLLSLRIFTDENGKINLGLEDVGGQVLVVSQFTLYGSIKKGRRPDFFGAAGPEKGNALYERFLAQCEKNGYPAQHGVFGAHMEVASVNDGPVTIMVDTRDL